ncbi:MAG: hypothetical protein J6P72_00550 [Firmicutes bacterium]|nr:hypothetical protein [Bacillota bacterium]
MSHRRRSSSQSILRNIISYIFSFVLSMALFAMTLLFIARYGVFDDENFISMLDDDYYRLCMEHIEDQANYYTLPTGIGTSVLEDVFSIDDVRYDVSRYVISAFDGVEYKPDMKVLENKLSDNVRNFFKADGVTITGETEDIISAYVEDIVNIYKACVEMPGLDMIVQIRNVFLTYYRYGMIACGIVIVLLIAFIIKLHHYPHRSMRYLAYACGGSALMSFVIPFILYQSGRYKGLGLNPEYFYHFGVSLVEYLLKLCMFSALLWAVVMIVLIVIIAALRSKQMSRRHHHSHSDF